MKNFACFVSIALWCLLADALVGWKLALLAAVIAVACAATPIAAAWLLLSQRSPIRPVRSHWARHLGPVRKGAAS